MTGVCADKDSGRLMVPQLGSDEIGLSWRAMSSVTGAEIVLDSTVEIDSSRRNYGRNLAVWPSS